MLQQAAKKKPITMYNGSLKIHQAIHNNQGAEKHVALANLILQQVYIGRRVYRMKYYRKIVFT